MNSPSEIESVRHLIELGYEDPFDIAQRKAADDHRRDARRAEAETLLASGRIDEAVARLEQLGSEFSDWPAPHFLLARVYAQRKRYTHARQHLDWLTFHGIESAALAALRATIDLGERRFDAAIDQANYAKYLSDDSTTADAILGEVYLRRGDLAAATAAFNRVLSVRPADAAALGGMAAIALRRRDYERAVDYALAALEQNILLPAVHYRLGVALVELDRLPEARAAFNTAVQLAPQLAAPYRWLATICDRLGDTEQAQQMTSEGRKRIRHRRQPPAPPDDDIPLPPSSGEGLGEGV